METISILVPTFNAEQYISKLIVSLNNQELDDGQSLELIIIDSQSADDTYRIVSRDHPEVVIQVIEKRQFNHGGTRNVLASMASGEYLLYMTQDAVPVDDQLVRRLRKPFVDQEVAVSYARQIPRRDAGPLETFARKFNYPEESLLKDKTSIPRLGIKAFFNSNACSMYRRSVFDQLGGFSESICVNEDLLFASEAIMNHFKVSYTADAEVYHSHNYRLNQQYKRYYEIGKFFQEMNHLLDYVSNEREGLKMARTLLQYLLSTGNIRQIPNALTETFVKYLGYRFGRIHKNRVR